MSSDIPKICIIESRIGLVNKCILKYDKKYVIFPRSKAFPSLLLYLSLSSMIIISYLHCRLFISAQDAFKQSEPSQIFGQSELMTKEVKTLIAEGYHNTDSKLNSSISRIVHEFPRVQWFSIGQTVEGRPIDALRVSIQPNISSKPSVAILGGLHGDHALGHEIVLHLGAFLAESTGHPRVNSLLEFADIILIPTLNPDGFKVSKEGDCYSAELKSGRHNKNGVDLDQDFKFHNYHDIGAILSNNNLQPETKSFVNWLVTSGENVQLFATLRTGYEGITYPLDEMPNQITEHTYRSPGSSNIPNVAPDGDLFEFIGHQIYYKYQDEPTESECNPLASNITVLDGARVGSVYGSLNDFLYEFANIFPMNIFLDCCKYPSRDKLMDNWLKHSNSIFAFLEAIKLGVRGSVVDKSSLKPIKKARIFVTGIDRNVSTSSDGAYWRPLVPDRPYDITIEADGYANLVRNQIKTTRFDEENVSSNILNFKLVPLKSQSISIPEHNSPGGPEDFSEISSRANLKPEALFNSTIDEMIQILDFKTPTNLHKHHNESELFNYLKDLNIRFPRISRLYDIGESLRGKKLWVLEISDRPGSHQLMKPEFRYIGNIHGNEVVGRELVLNLAKLLLENYGTNHLITAIVNSTRIHLLPSMNPDGYEKSIEGDCESEIGRPNDKGFDLNRNFPDQFKQTEENQILQPEVESIMRWSREYPFVLGANLHGGSVVANYPYDGNRDEKNGVYTAAPDDKLFVHLAKTYASNHATMYKGEHCFDICGQDRKSLLNERFKDGITNGAEWYVLYGGIQDWVYLHTNCLTITVELGCTKYPLAKDLPRYWNDNKKPLIKYMLQIHRGVYGMVRDQTNKILPNATIHVRGIDHDVHSTISGDYWRLLLPGEYFVSVSKEGYRTAHRIVAIGTDGLPVKRLDFWLSSGPKDLSSHDNSLAGPNTRASDESAESKKASSKAATMKNQNLKGSTSLNKVHHHGNHSSVVPETPDTRYMLALCFIIVLPSIMLILYLFRSSDGKREKLGFYRLATSAPDDLDGDDTDEGTGFIEGLKNNLSSNRADGQGSDSEDELYSADGWSK